MLFQTQIMTTASPTSQVSINYAYVDLGYQIREILPHAFKKTMEDN